MRGTDNLRRDLRVMVLTDPKPASGATLPAVVQACLDAGVRTVQLRDKVAPAASLLATARALIDLTRPAGARLLVNDRLDVALAAGADGVHLGPDDLPVDAARRLAPAGFLIGYSTDDPDLARAAAAAGADYLGVGAVYGTRSKEGLEDEAIGPGRLTIVQDSVTIPCLGIGGITPANATPVLATGAGIAVLSAVLHAPDPHAAAAELVHLAKTTPISDSPPLPDPAR